MCLSSFITAWPVGAVNLPAAVDVALCVGSIFAIAVSWVWFEGRGDEALLKLTPVLRALVGRRDCSACISFSWSPGVSATWSCSTLVDSWAIACCAWSSSSSARLRKVLGRLDGRKMALTDSSAIAVDDVATSDSKQMLLLVVNEKSQTMMTLVDGI